MNTATTLLPSCPDCLQEMPHPPDEDGRYWCEECDLAYDAADVVCFACGAPIAVHDDGFCPPVGILSRLVDTR